MLEILEVAEIQIVFIEEWIRKETWIAKLKGTTAKDQKSQGENFERYIWYIQMILPLHGILEKTEISFPESSNVF